MRHLGGKNLSATAVAVALAFIFAPVALAQPVSLEWSATYSGTGEAAGRALALDAGNLYVTGDTWPVGAPYTSDDAILLKYDISGNPGNLIWDETWGGSNRERGQDVGVCATEVYVGGYTYTYAYDPLGDLERDAVTLKWSHDGVLDTSNSADGWWTRYSGDSGYYGTDEIQGLATDTLGNVYVAGGSQRSSNNLWAYTEQHNASGVTQWHQNFDASEPSQGCESYGLIRSGDYVYATGRTRLDNQVIVLKYQTDGSPVWSYVSETTNQVGLDIAVLGSDIYVAGWSGIPSDPNDYDVLLLKLRDNGASAAYVDSTVFVTPGADIGWGIHAAGGQIWIAGSTESGGGTDALLLAYDTWLNLLWDYTWGDGAADAAYDVEYSGELLYVTGADNGEAFTNAYDVPYLPPIPAVSEWGVVAMTLLVLAAGTVVFTRRRAAQM